jgi:hypothetical protein
MSSDSDRDNDKKGK